MFYCYFTVSSLEPIENWTYWHLKVHKHEMRWFWIFLAWIKTLYDLGQHSKKGDSGTEKVGWETGNISCETGGYRGRETRSIHSKYAEQTWNEFHCRLSSEHTLNVLHRWLNIRGINIIAGWAHAETFKSWISIRLSKISCYRPLRQ